MVVVPRLVMRLVNHRGIPADRRGTMRMILAVQIVVRNRIAARMARMRADDHDRARDQRAKQRQEDKGLDHNEELALHQINVLNRDRPAVAEVDDENGQSDRGFGRGDGEHQQRKDLANDVVHEGGERHQIDVDREQDQLDRH